VAAVMNALLVAGLAVAMGLHPDKNLEEVFAEERHSDAVQDDPIAQGVVSPIPTSL
jgi:hypothetical protein